MLIGVRKLEESLELRAAKSAVSKIKSKNKAKIIINVGTSFLAILIVEVLHFLMMDFKLMPVALGTYLSGLPLVTMTLSSVASTWSNKIFEIWKQSEDDGASKLEGDTNIHIEKIKDNEIVSVSIRKAEIMLIVLYVIFAIFLILIYVAYSVSSKNHRCIVYLLQIVAIIINYALLNTYLYNQEFNTVEKFNAYQNDKLKTLKKWKTKKWTLLRRYIYRNRVNKREHRKVKDISYE